ncbi:MAG: YkvA family protein [Candidatus Dojkabacteria bacterium]|nr:YkvA family protein [Candidatus Dojkabacteria bacterium]
MQSCVYGRAFIFYLIIVTTVDQENQPNNQDGQTPSRNGRKKLSSFIKDNWTLIAVLLYVISPVDLIPEALLPLIGAVDDGVVAAAELLRRWIAYKKS